MNDLVAFLRARLDEDETVARASAAEPHHFYADGHYGAVAEFLDRWDPVDPARVLREVAAKRRILAEYDEHSEYDTEDWADEGATGRIRGLGEAVRYLAAVWSDHPDYQPEWKPEVLA